VATERLYALGEGREGERFVKTLKYLRDATEFEVSETKRADTALRPFTEDSPMARLQRETALLSQTMETALTTRGTANMMDAGSAIHRQFSVWLFAFRACDDHTAHQLSQSFGVSSTAFRAFRALTALEYDRDFAYRLCCQLRNADQHVGDVINWMRLDVQSGDDEGDRQATLVTQLDPAGLASEFPRMKPAVRAELFACTGNLELILLVRSAALSWDRIACGLLLAVWDDIAPLVDLCTSLHAEALNAGGLWAVFIDAAPEDVPDGNWQIRHNPYQRAELVTRNRATCEEAQRREVSGFPPSVFTLDEGDDPPELPI